MVIIKTSAVDVSIQAVSPAEILSTLMNCGSVGAGDVLLAAGAAAAAEDARAAAATADS